MFATAEEYEMERGEPLHSDLAQTRQNYQRLKNILERVHRKETRRENDNDKRISGHSDDNEDDSDQVTSGHYNDTSIHSELWKVLKL